MWIECALFLRWFAFASLMYLGHFQPGWQHLCVWVSLYVGLPTYSWGREVRSLRKRNLFSWGRISPRRTCQLCFASSAHLSFVTQQNFVPVLDWRAKAQAFRHGTDRNASCPSCMKPLTRLGVLCCQGLWEHAHSCSPPCVTTPLTWIWLCAFAASTMVPRTLRCLPAHLCHSTNKITMATSEAPQPCP